VSARVGAPVISRLTRELCHQLPEEIECSQRNIKPNLALYGANRDSLSIVPRAVAQLRVDTKSPQPKAPRSALQDLLPWCVDHWVGQRAAPIVLVIIHRLRRIRGARRSANEHRLKMEMRP